MSKIISILNASSLSLLLVLATDLSGFSTASAFQPLSQTSAAQETANSNASRATEDRIVSAEPAEDRSATASAVPITGTVPRSDAAEVTTAKDVRTSQPFPPSKNAVAAEAAPNTNFARASSTTNPAALTEIYRVGVGDVLDISLLNAPTRASTLFTVLPDGVVDYPLAGDPISVLGLTTNEIAERLAAEITLYENPRVSVGIRQYNSHTVIVTGLVSDPGSKVLRREAVPLYVVLSEALPRSDAGQATIMRPGSQPITIELSDDERLSTLLMSGDLIKISAVPPKFFYIGGSVSLPGQKSYHTGITLTQAILASGGVTRSAGSEVKVMRQEPDGRLATVKYNLKRITAGKDPDPALQPGDRIDVSRSGLR